MIDLDELPDDESALGGLEFQTMMSPAEFQRQNPEGYRELFGDKEPEPEAKPPEGEVSDEGAIRGIAEKHGLATRPENLEHVFGPVCWILTQPEPLAEPIPAKGKLNIWKYNVDAEKLRVATVR